MNYINIAICDDETEICTHLEKLLTNLLKEVKVDFQIDIFIEGEGLVKEMERTQYDLIFLDIELPEMNGVEVGTYIRESLKNERVQIAYISAKESYAMELFDTRPINFLVKPLNEEKVKKIVDKYMAIAMDNIQMFTYKKGREFNKIQLSDILYFESNNRKVIIVTNERTEEFYGSLENIYQKVKANKFLYVHKSFIVNYRYIKKIEYEKLIMVNGQVISISQSRRSDVRSMFMKISKREM